MTWIMQQIEEPMSAERQSEIEEALGKYLGRSSRRKPSMLLAYVSGPYRDPRGEYYVKQNIRAAEDVTVELWRMGYAVFCPHTNTAFLGGACGDSEPWIVGDLEILDRCDLVVMFGDWKKSAGAISERNYAMTSSPGVPVFYWPSEEHILQDIANGNRPLRQQTFDELVYNCYVSGPVPACEAGAT